MITFLASPRLHRLDGIAGIDRPLEGVGRDDLGDLRDLSDVEQGCNTRQHVLAESRWRPRRSCHSSRPAKRSAPPAARPGCWQDRRCRRGAPWIRRTALRQRRRQLWRPSLPPAHARRAPILVAAVSALAVWLGKRCVVVVSQKKNGHGVSLPVLDVLEDAGFVLQLVDQLADRLDLDAGLAAFRLLGLQQLSGAGSCRRRNRPGSSCRAASSSPS